MSTVYVLNPVKRRKATSAGRRRKTTKRKGSKIMASRKRSLAAKKAWRTRRAKSAARSRAAKKAARSRKRRNPRSTTRRVAKKRANPRRRRSRRKNPVRRLTTKLYTNPRRRRRAARKNPARRRRRVSRRRNPKIKLLPSMATVTASVWGAGGFMLNKAVGRVVHYQAVERFGGMLGAAKPLVSHFLGTALTTFIIQNTMKGRARQNMLEGNLVQFGYGLVWNLANLTGLAQNPVVNKYLLSGPEPIDVWSSGQMADYVVQPSGMGYTPGGQTQIGDYVTMPRLGSEAPYAMDYAEALPTSGRLMGAGLQDMYYGLD